MVFECSKSNSESGSDDNQSDDGEQPVKKPRVSCEETSGATRPSGPPADTATTGPPPVQAPPPPPPPPKRLSAASILIHMELEVQSMKVPREPILIT